MIAADGDGWNGCSKRLLAADGDGAEMEQFVKGGNLAIILHGLLCDRNNLQMCAAQSYKVVAAAEKERAGSFSVRWSRSRRSRTA